MEKKETKGFWASIFRRKMKPEVSDKATYAPEVPTCCGELSGEECACSVKAPSNAVEDVKVLGPGCARCVATFKVVEKVIRENGLNASLTKVSDIEEMMSYNIMQTPAVVVNGEVVIKGRVPTENEVKKILGV